MNNTERKIILLGVSIIIVIMLIVFVNTRKGNKDSKEINAPKEQNTEGYITNLEDGTKLNNSEEFNKSRKYKDIEISNIQFTYENGKSVLLAKLKNVASTKHNLEIVKLTILGANGEKIDEIEPLLPELEAGEEGQLNATISGADIVNAKDFIIEEKK